MPHNGFKTKKYKEQWQLVLSKRDLLVTTPNPGGKNPKKCDKEIPKATTLLVCYQS